MRSILQKKGENLDFRLFFEFESLNMLDIADYDLPMVLDSYTTINYLYLWHDYAKFG